MVEDTHCLSFEGRLKAIRKQLGYNFMESIFSLAKIPIHCMLAFIVCLHSLYACIHCMLAVYKKRKGREERYHIPATKTKKRRSPPKGGRDRGCRLGYTKLASTNRATRKTSHSTKCCVAIYYAHSSQQTSNHIHVVYQYVVTLLKGREVY